MRCAEKKKSYEQDNFPKIRHERKQHDQVLEEEELDELLEYMSVADTKRWKL